MTKKTVIRAERVEVFYDSKHWELLRELRSKAAELMEILEDSHVSSIVHGSIARGDVSETSDIDVFVSDMLSSFAIEASLERAGVNINRRIIVQATPSYAIKGYIEIDECRTISFPLAKLRSVEENFYKFSGQLSLSNLKQNLRVSGVDKRLMLIEPTPKGHFESSITGREENVAHLLGVPPETVLNRSRALSRRDQIGRTGVFIKRELTPDETFEMVLKKLVDHNPAVRRRMKLSEK
jgi:predicted nucleotidyltransferase